MVTMVTTQTIMTAEELIALPDDGFRYELVRGELRKMPPAGSEHGIYGMSVSVRIAHFVATHGLGVTFLAETGFKIGTDPDTVRAPDCAFVRKERIPPGRYPIAYWPGAPDLAVEVVSPDDSAREVTDKAMDWLAAGTRMVIVVSPRNRTVTVYRPNTEITVLTEKDELTGGDVLPGFVCPVAEIFG